MSSEIPPAKPRQAVNMNRWRLRIVMVLTAAVGIPVGATVLYTHPPTQSNSWFPGCMFRTATGLHCAGCGATRAVYSLACGDPVQAFAYNPLFLLMSPLIAYGAMVAVYEMWTGKRIRMVQVSRRVLFVLLGIIVAFWIARNIDVYPLAQTDSAGNVYNVLAPHKLPAPPP